MKARITLRYKDDSTGVEAGKLEVIYNEIFEFPNGIAYSHIEWDKFELVKVEQFTGFYTKDKTEIYVGDKVQATFNPITGKVGKVMGEVVFDLGAMSVKIIEINTNDYDIGGCPPMYNFKKFELV